MPSKHPPLLGEYAIANEPFSNLEATFAPFHEASFRALPPRKRFKRINTTLLQLIQDAPVPCFLLFNVLDFIGRVNSDNLMPEPYTFAAFEFWLNHFGKLSDEENQLVRGKIAGRYVPREAYQLLFPIGMGHTLSGSHFVAAHASPDVDTTVASFWGWMDAFAARVASGVHLWSLPNHTQTPPDAHLKLLFQQLLGQNIFDQLARSVPTLTLTARDLVDSKDFIKVHGSTLATNLNHSHAHKALVLVDDTGHYVGDWWSGDTESVRQIVILFTGSLRWFAHAIHAGLIDALTHKRVTVATIRAAIEPLLATELHVCEPAKEFSDKQRRQLQEYLQTIFHLEHGTRTTFRTLVEALDTVTDSHFAAVLTALDALMAPDLFDAHGHLIEDRPLLMHRLAALLESIDKAILEVRLYIDQLAVMNAVKVGVFGEPRHFVTLRSDVDEIHSKIGDRTHITVVVPEGDDQWFPIGTISANDLKRATLGTISLRDFSNERETQMASYLEVVSVIDHHKTELRTNSAATMLVGDAQSANTLLAEQAHAINSRFSTLGIDPATIDRHITALRSKNQPALLAQLYALKHITDVAGATWVHPRREFGEYLCYIYAILDDTDLLSKVTARDVESLAHLLNRMKAIASRDLTPIISFDDIPRDGAFATAAARRILQNPDMYSIYRNIYAFKAQEMESNLAACVAHKPSSVFADTKEQNGCCRVGQTKLFNSNFKAFLAYAPALRTLWYTNAKALYDSKPQIDFHMQMISTIPGADEVYKGGTFNWDHRDEIWFWIPSTQRARERLISFLNAWHASPAVQTNELEVEFLGSNAAELAQIFEQNCPKASRMAWKGDVPQGLPIAVLRIRPGSMNSRKAMITPYLPRFVP